MISHTASRAKGNHRRRGFTLIELIVALAVISVAATIYFSFYGSSLVIGRTARNRTIAGQLAEARMQHIQAHPDRYLWQLPEERNLERFPVLLSADDPKAGNPVALPAALPVAEAARRKEKVLYDSFRWQAWGRLPAPGATSVEVTVVIRWKEGGREEVIALTSAVPGGFLPAPVMAPEIPEAPADAAAEIPEAPADAAAVSPETSADAAVESQESVAPAVPESTVPSAVPESPAAPAENAAPVQEGNS